MCTSGPFLHEYVYTYRKGRNFQSQLKKNVQTLGTVANYLLKRGTWNGT